MQEGNKRKDDDARGKWKDEDEDEDDADAGQPLCQASVKRKDVNLQRQTAKVLGLQQRQMMKETDKTIIL